MDKREQALKDFPNEVNTIEQCNCKCIGYTTWPDKIVRFSFNTVNGDTLVVEQKECNKDKIIEKVNESFKRRNKDVESAITNLPIRQDHQFVTGNEFYKEKI